MPGDVSAIVGYLNPEVLQEGGGEVELGSKNTRQRTTVKKTKLFHDARQAGELTLDKNGVCLVTFKSAVKDYHNQEECKSVLYPEAAELCKRLSGAKYVHVYSHYVRSEDPVYEAKLSGNGVFSHAYARFAHIDGSNPNSTDWGRGKLRSEFGLSEEECGAERMDVLHLNVWKPYDREVAQNPLAILDCATLEDKDVVRTIYTGNGGRGKMSQVLDSESHRWLYWPKMQTDEALVFKQMDNREGVARYGFHISFDDPTAPVDAPGRRSVELRIVLGIPKPAGQAKL